MESKLLRQKKRVNRGTGQINSFQDPRTEDPSWADDHRGLHRGCVQVAMIRIGPGSGEGVLEPIPWLEQRRPTGECLPPA
jgi:hypothetical protein